MRFPFGSKLWLIVAVMAALGLTACGRAEQEQLRQELNASQAQVDQLTVQFEQVQGEMGTVQERLGEAQAQVAHLTQQVEQLELAPTEALPCRQGDADGASLTNGGSQGGDLAPDFTLADVDGRKVTLSQLLLQNKAVVIVFYRGFF